MRCLCCDRLLSDYEATRRHGMTGEFLDMCNPCFAAVSEVTPLPVRDRKDLITEVDIDQELQELDDNQEV